MKYSATQHKKTIACNKCLFALAFKSNPKLTCAEHFLTLGMVKIGILLAWGIIVLPKKIPAEYQHAVDDLISQTEQEKQAWLSCCDSFKEHDWVPCLNRILQYRGELLSPADLNAKMNAQINCRAWDKLIRLMRANPLLDYSDWIWIRWQTQIAHSQVPDFNRESVSRQLSEWWDNADALFAARINTLWEHIRLLHPELGAQREFPATLKVPNVFDGRIQNEPMMSAILTKTFSLLALKTATELPQMDTVLYAIKRQGVFRQWHNVSGFAALKLFKNGNVDVRFTPDALAILNSSLSAAQAN